MTGIASPAPGFPEAPWLPAAWLGDTRAGQLRTQGHMGWEFAQGTDREVFLSSQSSGFGDPFALVKLVRAPMQVPWQGIPTCWCPTGGRWNFQLLNRFVLVPVCAP